MRVTADKEYLKKVVDKADCAMVRATLGREEGKKHAHAEFDSITANNYFTYLAVKALEDEEFCEDLEETLGELVEEGTLMEPQLVFLARFLQVGRWVRYDPEDNPGVEELEKDFEEFFGRVSDKKAREEKKKFTELVRSQTGGKAPANEMYG